jgi:hypothetical protein
VAKAERPEPTPAERFMDTARKLFQVPKEEVRKAELRRKKERDARRTEQPK